VGGSITSGFLFGSANALANANVATNPHIRFMEFARNGYGVLDAAEDELRVRYRSPVTIAERESTVETIASFRVARGVPRVELA
jgi:phosphodiesterase/alkaline phosphatase D-like protein